ncbi:MAG TPA: hypothetical protein VGU61_11450 [Noviherbaspirillum sp.]|uniref:hypothetical protein n=1 Tax=Noviherbaspirillum sp. TaxID=1926288 RepID=UPI002DDD8EDB|nr:hypothetical protein [Noviherbaspirillum sp.]HEV2610874.1 hypothetical protein [Noviherbaspirillum sp.]
MTVPDRPDNDGLSGCVIPLERLSLGVARYVLPSLYCESDRLGSLAQISVGFVPQGRARVQAMCDRVHANTEYR